MSTPQLSRIRVQRIAEEAVERARLRVVPRTRVNAPRVPFVVLMSALLLAGVVGLLMFNTTMQQNSFALAQLQTEADAARAEKQQLEQDLRVLNDPQHIAEEARSMGMELPACPRFLDLGSSKVTPPCDAAPAQLDVSQRLPNLPDALVPARTVVEVTPQPKQWELQAQSKQQAKKVTKKSQDTRKGATR